MAYQARFFVAGSPVCMGSSRAALHHGRAILVQHNGGKIKTWQRAIQVVASAHAPEAPLDCPMRVLLGFHLRAPKKPKFPAAPAARLDADKLARAALDALTGMIYRDDSRVVRLAVSKLWAAPDELEGVDILVEELPC
jgi:crossover junction endodeoxyribonuclease RusA